MKKRKPAQTPLNLLELVPVQNIDWKKEQSGLIVLLKPKFQHPLLQKHVLPRLKNPYYRIKLDSVGSFLWEKCDGKTTVRELGQKLKHQFGDDVKPIYDRMALFLQSLEKNRFIFYRGLNRERK